MVKCRSLAFLLAVGLLPALLSAQSLEPDEYHYTYDAANNLTSRKTITGGMETTETLPVDPSGRNRPASLGGVPLAWDANGNLIQKGDLRLAYDYRNQLLEVRDPLGETIASYAYDALGRRVRQTIGSEVTETVWKAWQPVETYVNGMLASRRVYGGSIDEIAYVEQDTDLDGILETRLHPVYDSSGNLAVVTGENGKPIERYSYDPYGGRRIYVDSTPPRIDQILATDTGIWIEFSEMVNASGIESGITAGAIRLEDDDPSTAYTLTAEPLHLHAKRHRLTLVPDPLPAPGTSLTLTFEPETLTDYFLNRPTSPESFTFSWPVDYAVAYDATPPVVAEVRYTDTALEVEFSQIINPDIATPSIQLDGMVTTWAVASENTYRLVSQQPVPSGTYDLLITTDLANVAGRPLAEAFSMQLVVNLEVAPQIAYREPDSREVDESSVANAFGFHGLPRDPVTGFVYVRNRYYDPEMGRFITTDPTGYVDGPSMYAAFANDPVNNRDPLGLDAMAIAFVDYRIAVGDRRLENLGHAAVVTLGEHGRSAERLSTKYFEYGRYDTAQIGKARNRWIPDADVGANGLPTRESLKKILKAVAERYGQKSRIRAAYFVTSDDSTAQMNTYAWRCVKESTNPEREPYSIWTNNCGTFAEDVVQAGGVGLLSIIDPRPNYRVPLWQAAADFSIEYDPATDELVVDESFFTAEKEEILKWKSLPLWKKVFTERPH